MFCGIVGRFDCQGAGKWSPNVSADNVPVATSAPSFISGHVRPQDVESLEQVAGENGLEIQQYMSSYVTYSAAISLTTWQGKENLKYPWEFYYVKYIFTDPPLGL
ncbi:unnamed protein product [Dovyalis caffra]|uniref:Uncharacterized protein n=1 Tax=Dovyalis caffra TaxID=77055 RepID=A0AAV1RLG0_9ROSI|nr:unnamed protein product [Dovyalis caffra]